jgi:hypothetical protein
MSTEKAELLVEKQSIRAPRLLGPFLKLPPLSIDQVEKEVAALWTPVTWGEPEQLALS